MSYTFCETSRSGFSTFTYSEGAKTAFASPQPKGETRISQVVEISATGEIAEIDVSGITFTSLAIAGDDYEVTFDPENIETGQYYFNPETNIITAKLRKRQPVARAYLRVNQTEFESSNVSLLNDEFFKIWNVEDRVSLNRTLNGFPTCNCEFTVLRENILSTRLALDNGKKVNLFGIPFRIKSLVFKPRQQDDTSVWKATINFESLYAPYADPSRNKLDEKIRLKGDDCDNPKSGWQSYADYAKEVPGAPNYAGKPIYIYVGKQTSSEEVITLRELITQRAILNGQFPVYSSPLGIVCKDWLKTKLHNKIPRSNYISTVENGFYGAGYRDPATQVQLIKELRNAEFKPAQLEELVEEEQNKVTVRWEFERAQSLLDCQSVAEPFSVGEAVYIIKTPETKLLRNPGNAHDSGGLTKVAHKIHEIDGVEIYRETKTFGWVFSSLDTYSVVDKDAEISGDSNYSKSVAVGEYYRIIFTPFAKFAFLASMWTEVSSVITTRTYDDENGYLVQEETIGKKLSRVSQDSDRLEGISTRLEALELKKATEDEIKLTDDPDKLIELGKQLERAEALLKLAESYRFTTTEPVYKLTTYESVPYSFYYSDITKPADTCFWVEPRFLRKSITVERRNEVIDNPGSTTDYPLPQILKGKLFTEEFTQKITSKKKPGKYTSKRYLVNSEGQGLRRKLKLINPKEHNGRPPQHQRLEITEAQAPQGFTSGLSVNSLIAQKVDKEANDEFKYLFNTPGSDPNEDITESTFSYPDTFDPDLAKTILETQLSIDNTTAAELLTIELLYDGAFCEGDRYVHEGKQYVIGGIKYDTWIDDQYEKVEKYTLSLGRAIKVKIDVEKVQNKPVDVKSKNIANGLLALDGNINQFNSILKAFPPEIIAKAIALDVLPELIDSIDFGLQTENEFSQVDGISSFLEKSAGGFSDSDSNALTINNTIQPDLEDGEFNDFRQATTVEDLVDILDRSGSLGEFLDKFRDLLAERFKEDQLDLQDGESSGSEEGSGGSSGGSLPPTPPLFNAPAPNVNFLGSDNLLTKLLEGLFGQLLQLLDLLAGEEEEEGGGSGGAAGGGGGGQGGGGDSSAGRNPAISIGEKTIYFEAADLAGFEDLLLEMIALLKSLIANFSSETLREFLDKLISRKQAQKAGIDGGGGGAGGAGGGGTESTTIITTEFIVPPYDEVATINYVFEEEDQSAIDIDGLLSELDELLLALEELSENEDVFGEDFNFQFEPVEEGVLSPKGAEGTTPVNTADVDLTGAVPTASTPELGKVYEYYNQVLVEIKDISGVSTVAYKLPVLEPASTGSPSSAGSSGGSTSGATSGGLKGGLASASNPSENLSDNGGGAGDPTTPGSGTSTPGSGSSSSGSGSPEYTGDPGDPSYDGFYNPNDGYGDAPFVPGTNFAVEPIIPIDSGVEKPLTTLNEVISNLENEFVLTPESFSHDPDIDGELVLIEGLVASDLVIWEILSDPTGIELITPYDLDLTLEFQDNFPGGTVELKASLRGAPVVFDTLFIDTVYRSRFETERFLALGEFELGAGWQVETSSLVVDTLFGDPGIETLTSVPYRWEIPQAQPFSYTISSRQPDNSYLAIATVSEPKYIFDLGVIYRIEANYQNQIRVAISETFVIETAPIIARDRHQANALALTDDAVPISTEPTNFYIVLSSEDLTDNLTHAGKQLALVDDVFPISTEPSNFYTVFTNEDLTDNLTHAGKQLALADDVFPISTEPSNFYSI